MTVLLAARHDLCRPHDLAHCSNVHLLPKHDPPAPTWSLLFLPHILHTMLKVRPVGKSLADCSDAYPRFPNSMPTDTTTHSLTTAPTSKPTDTPTDAPTSLPTRLPTNVPMQNPITAPTATPTNTPTSKTDERVSSLCRIWSNSFTPVARHETYVAMSNMPDCRSDRHVEK